MRFQLAILSVALLLGAGLIPFAHEASADHVYSHRYLVQGRVVTDDGQPVQGASVTVELDGWLPQDEGVEGPCPQDPSNQRHQVQSSQTNDLYQLQTDEVGDYRLCIHGHSLIDAGQVVVTVGNTTVEDNKNLAQRTSYVDIKIPSGSAGQVGNVERFNSEVVFRGRLWQPTSQEERLETIPVTGVAPVDRAINITLDPGTGETISKEIRTDSRYGEFDGVFDYDGELDGATITARVNAEGEMVEETFEVDPDVRGVHTEFIIPHTLDTGGTPGPGVVALIGVLAVAGLVAARRRS